MPQLIRFVIRHLAIGFALALPFTGMLLWCDVANLWHLVTNTAEGPLAVVLLVVFNGIVFAGAQLTIALVLLADRDGPRGGRRVPVPVPVPVTSGRHAPRT
jgi:hypothetical protein